MYQFPVCKYINVYYLQLLTRVTTERKQITQMQHTRCEKTSHIAPDIQLILQLFFFDIRLKKIDYAGNIQFFF